MAVDDTMLIFVESNLSAALQRLDRAMQALQDHDPGKPIPAGAYGKLQAHVLIASDSVRCAMLMMDLQVPGGEVYPPFPQPYLRVVK